MLLRSKKAIGCKPEAEKKQTKKIPHLTDRVCSEGQWLEGTVSGISEGKVVEMSMLLK